MEVYVPVINYYYDDYKRSEGSSTIIGVFSDYKIGLLTVLKTEYLDNLGYWEEDKENEYYILYNSLDSVVEFSDRFLSKWAEARELVLGDSEFGGLFASGYRYTISQHVIDNHASDIPILTNEEKENDDNDENTDEEDKNLIIPTTP